MSIYSNGTEQDLINLYKLAEQQKDQRAEKIKNRISKQTHDVKLVESLSPIAEKLDVVKKSTPDLGDVIKETQPQTPQLAFEDTPTTRQPIKNNEGTIYDVELENTLNKMKDNTGFFKTQHNPLSGLILNKFSIGMPGGTEVEISGNKYDITPGLQKVFTDTKYETAKSMGDMEEVVCRDILSKINYYNRKTTKGKMSGRDRYIENDLDNDVRIILI